METITIRDRSLLGALRGESGIRFAVWAPHAKQVYVCGSFNNWKEKQFPLERTDGGYWETEVREAGQGDSYQYLIEKEDGTLLWRNDPYARSLTNSAGDSLIDVDDYDWEEDDFTVAHWNELIIYEMHIGTFHVKEKGRAGTFATAIEKLPYLKDLGINAVELMPVSEFAGDFSWGYNPAFPFAVEEAYGGPNGLKDFVKAAHRHGIAVILDVVYNHFGPSDLDLWQFDGWEQNGKGGIYFYNDWRSRTPWGDTRPDYGRPEVRQYIYDNAMMWLEDFRCDGLRMDMVPYIRNVDGDEDEGGRIEEGFDLLKWINHSIREQYPDKITVAEDLHGNDFITDAVTSGGCGFGTQWDADFVHPVRKQLIAAEDAHRSMQALADAMLRLYSGDFFRRVVYTESHDEIANGQARLPQEISDDVNNYYSKKKSALGAVLVLTAAGIPMLFQGQELLEDRWFSDQDPIEWKRLDKFNGIHRMYRDLIALRSNRNGNSRGLQGQHTDIIHLNEDDKTMVYCRWMEDKARDGVLVVLNFSSQTQENYKIGLPATDKWKLRFNSDWKGYDHEFDEAYDGQLDVQEGPYDRQPCHAEINLAPYAAYIYTVAQE
jgi:1,4-alpha-glucan branching enzyme